MRSPEELLGWCHQQRDAFRRFFAAAPTAGEPHVSRLFEHEGLAYLGPGEPTDAYLRRSHCMKSHVLPLRFAVQGEPRELQVPAPADDGVFTVNGKRYTAPIQRLVWRVEPLRAEYRRIDQAILDGAVRAPDRQASARRGARKPPKSSGTDADDAFAKLAAYLLDVLTPTRRGELLFILLNNDLNWLGALARQTQVVTLRLDAVPGADADADPDWTPGKTPYRRLRRAAQLGMGVRTLQAPSSGEPGDAADEEDQPASSDDGLDVFHTPEGAGIGLVRYLACGATVDQDRRLCAVPGETCGLVASLLPFAQHNDGRRLTMACGMLTRAVPLGNGAPSACQTQVGRLVCGNVPGAHPNLGVDLRTGFMFWEGLNYEDAIVVSQTAQAKLHTEERRIVQVPVPCFCSYEPIERGVTVRCGQPLGSLSFSPSRLALNIPMSLQAADRREAGFFPEQLPWPDCDYRSPCDGVVEEVSRVELWSEDCLGASRFSGRVDFTIRVDRPLRVGDKLCNLHGNKGVVSAVVPDEAMPQVEGLPLEILFNPIGVVNRGNYGQLLEALAATEPTGELTPDLCTDPGRRLRALLSGRASGSLLHSLVTIPGEGGGVAVRAVTGLNYILRLPHYAADSMGVMGEGVYSSITEQPPTGLGQKYGEMEVAALQAHGAHAILAELCRARSRQSPVEDARSGGAQRPIVEGLRAAGLDLRCTDATVTLCPADLTSVPSHGVDLFSPTAKSGRDLACNVDGNEKRNVPLKVLLRRLSSRGFFDDNPGVYIDLGETFELDLARGAEDGPCRLAVRYLPVLHPKYRPVQAGGAGRSEATAMYDKLLAALWHKRQQPQGEADNGGIKRALASVLGHMRQRLRGKHGVVRRVGLSRRLTYSGRFVIVPGPSLSIDEVSLPWDAIRVLFARALQAAGIADDVLDTPASLVPECERDGIATRADWALHDERVLLNRNPSLHKYSILSFRPRTHFDTDAMRLPLLVTSPFGADFDGDQMSAVPVLEPAAREEAAGLSVARNLISDADGSPTAPPTKDLRLALWLAAADPVARQALNHDLAVDGVPPLEGGCADAGSASADAWLRGLADLGTERTVRALDLVVKHGLGALRAYSDHSCFGDHDAMARFLAPMLDSKAAKRDVMDGNRDLVAGVPLDALRRRGLVCTNILVGAKVAVGNFGGYAHRLYYRLPQCYGTGLAFDGPMRNALVAIQSITERATQRALGAKSASDQLSFGDFQRALEATLGRGDGVTDPRRIAALAEMVGIDEAQLGRLLGNLAPLLDERPAEGSLLRYLANQSGLILDGRTEGIAGDRRDPRISLFLS